MCDLILQIRSHISANQVTHICKSGHTYGFQKVSRGHYTLKKIVPELMKATGFSGYITNHNLCARAAI